MIPNLEEGKDDDYQREETKEEEEDLSEEESGYTSEEANEEDEISSEEEDDDTMARLLADPLCQQDPLSMRLSAQERRWALELKDAVESNPKIENLSDMWIAHYAIIAQGDLGNAIQRINAMQTYQKEYQIDHSVEQGLFMFAAMLQLQPNWVLSIDVDSVTLEGLHVIDNSQLTMSAMLETEGTWHDFTMGHYYFFYLCQPTLATVRNGNYTMIDWGGFDWHNLSWEFISRINEEFLALYPIKFSKCLGFNTNMLANIMMSMTKHIYPKALMDVFQFGCRVPMAELDESPRSLANIYQQPSQEATHQRMISRAKDLLLLRAKNEAQFRL